MKEHMVTIGVYQQLSNSAIYEHRCLENIKKLCKPSGKYDYQHQCKSIIELAMLSTPEVLTNKIPM